LDRQTAPTGVGAVDDDLDDAADTTMTKASPSAASSTTSASGRTARKPATRRTGAGAGANGNGSNGNGNGNGRSAGSKSAVSELAESKSTESGSAETEPVEDKSAETEPAESELAESGSAESKLEPEDVSDVSTTLFAPDDSATESATAHDSADTNDATSTYDSAGTYGSGDTLYSSDSFYSGDAGQTVGIPPQDGFKQDTSPARPSWEEDREEPAADTLATSADGVWSYELTESPFTPEPLLAAPPMPSELPYRPPSASARYVANLAKKPSFTPSSSSSASSGSSFGSSSSGSSLADSTAATTSAPPAQAFPRPPGSTTTRPAAPKPKAPKVPKPKAAPKPKASVKRSGARQAHLTISRVEPWSVMKFSFAVSVVAFIILFIAVAVLYGILSALGVFDSIQHLVSSVTSSSDQAGVNADKWFSASRILGYTVLLGGLNIVLITAVSTIGAVIYNLTSRLIGGVEVTLKEAD
jgi:Transmembrane domain of unknown function (DUF3566)